MSAVQYIDGMDYGLGFDTLRTRPRGLGVDVAEPVPRAPGDYTGGQIVTFSLQRVTSMEDYQSSLDLSVGVKASFGLWGGSAKFNYSQAHKFHTYSDYVIAKVLVENPLLMIHGITPNTDAKTLVQNGSTQQFQEEFGDTYVEGMKSGGAYYAVLEFVSKSDEQQQEIGASLSFSYLTFSGNAEFKSHLQDITQGSSLQISSFQMGGADPKQKLGISLEEILTKVDSFPSEVLPPPGGHGGVYIQAFIQDYKSLHFPEPPNLIDIETRDLKLIQFYRSRNILIQKLNDIEYITEHPDDFENVDSYQLPEARQKIQGWLDAITKGASNCANTIHECLFQEPVMEIINFPPRKVSTPPAAIVLNVTFDIPPGVDANQAQEWINELANVYADMAIQDVHFSGNKGSFTARFSGNENITPIEAKTRIQQMFLNSGFSNVFVT